MLLLLWPIRFALYLLHLVLFYGYGFLVFLSKPGGRVIFPLLVVGLVIWQADFMGNHVFTDALIADLARWIPVNPEDEVGFALALLVLFLAGVWAFSLLLRPILGALPPLRKPMPPLRRLRPRLQQKPSAPARIVVPSLSSAFGEMAEAQLVQRLPPHLRKLLEPKENRPVALEEITRPPPEAPDRSSNEPAAPAPARKAPKVPRRRVEGNQPEEQGAD